jgi:chromobox protein 1
MARFEVEKIVTHQKKKGRLYYRIRWAGFKPEDDTWELPKDISDELLTKYHRKCGGPHHRDRAPKSRILRTSGTFEKIIDGIPTTWVPEEDDWEPYISKITAIEKDDKTGDLLASIQFKNGKTETVGMVNVYRHCPRPMLKFYEKHL